MHRLEDREEMVLVKVSKITKVRKGNRTFYVLENYLDWLLTMTRLTKWEENWLLTLKNALTTI